MKGNLPILFKEASLLNGDPIDVRIEAGKIAQIGVLHAQPRETIISAKGGLILPGLHDHHIHLLAAAAAQSSVACGPPEISTADELAAALGCPGQDWIRGVGYHESVAGVLDRQWLDAACPSRPVRIQHRGGRMWFFNSLGVERLLASGDGVPEGFDRGSGRLFDNDAWLRRTLSGHPPPVDTISQTLSRYGVTGITDMGAGNGSEIHALFYAAQRDGNLRQRAVLAGREDLSELSYDDELGLGPVKIHLHEANLPDLDQLIVRIRLAHDWGRVVAIHCVTLAELVFALVAIRDAGAVYGDRIEHASMATDAEVHEIAEMGLFVAIQPMFVHERGNDYLRDIAPAEWLQLYRYGAFRDAGVTMVGSSDAPYVSVDPWAAMDAAIHRRARTGAVIGACEALTPEEALNLYLADPACLSRKRTIEVGAVADLCLLDRPWSLVREGPTSEHVRLTMIDGAVVHGCNAA